MGLELTMKMPLEGWTFASSSAKGVKWMFCVRAHINANSSANITAFDNVSKSLTYDMCNVHLHFLFALAFVIYTCTFFFALFANVF